MIRVIPCLDVDRGRVVKGVNFVGLRDAGDPVELASRYDREGADELVFLDITATHEERDTIIDLVERTADEVFIPFTIGGGLRTEDDIRAVLAAGADKVSLNSAAVRDPDLIANAAGRFGDQCIVVSVDVRRSSSAPSGFEATTHGGRKSSGKDALEWIIEAAQRGAGEVLLNSMDADGTKNGYDLELITRVRAVVDIPIIASGGAGKLTDFAPAVAAGADAVLAASVFHFLEISIAQVKNELRSSGIQVR